MAAARPCEHGFRVNVPPQWHQGRTAYGGLSTALALSAVLGQDGDLPPLRSTQIAMIAPLYGEVEVRARIVRRGRNAIWAAAEISGEKGIGLTASFVFMAPVQSALHFNDNPVPRGLIGPDNAAALSNERGAIFLRHNFDIRFALPKTSNRRAEMCWWVRARDRDGLDPMVELMLCADACPPGVMPLLDSSVPVSTMCWQSNLLTPKPATRDGWWLLRSVGDYAQNGCSSQRMSIWNAAGLPIVAGLQSIALFG